MIKCVSLSEAAALVDQHFNTGTLAQDRVRSIFDCIPPHVPISLVDSEDECYKLSYNGRKYKRSNYFSYQMMFERLMTDVVVDGELYTAAHFQFGREGDLKSLLGDPVSIEKKAKMKAWYDSHTEVVQAMNHYKVVECQQNDELREQINGKRRQRYSDLKLNDPEGYKRLRERLNELCRGYYHKMKDEDPDKFASKRKYNINYYWSIYKPRLIGLKYNKSKI